MICPACSCENEPQTTSCAACAARLAPHGDVPGSDHSGSRSHAEQIADVDRQIAELTQRLQAAHAIRAAIGEVQPRDDRAPAVPHGDSGAPATIDVGSLRLTLGGPHGAQIEPAAAWNGDDGLHGRGELLEAAPPIDLRPKVTTAVWQAFSSGASSVRVDAKAGAGATTLLLRLATGAREAGFTDGAVLLTDVRGPAADVAQRLTALLDAGERPRYYTEPERSRAFGGVRALILLDRAELTAADEEQLVHWFALSRFVIVDSTIRAAVPTIALGPLAAADAIAVLESGYGRSIDPDDRSIALDLCTPIGPFPGPTRLLGLALRELHRSLISLRLQFDSGNDVIREFIRQLPQAEQRTLAILALTRMPLRPDQLAMIAGHDVHASLDRLAKDGLVRRGAADLYELPSFAAGLIAPAVDADALFGRLIEVAGRTIDPRLPPGVLDRQLAAAESVLHAAAERSLHTGVLLIGPRLGDACARRGAFGAWGRILQLIETAATRTGNAAALDRTHHELGVRALLLGEFDEATTCLRSASRGRKTAGDGSGAAASAGVLALADLPPAARADAAAADKSLPPRRRRGFGKRTLVFVLLGLFFAAVAISALSFQRPQHARSAQRPTLSKSDRRHAGRRGGATVRRRPERGRRGNLSGRWTAAGSGRNCVTVHPATTTTYVAVGTAPDGQRAQAAMTVLVQNAASARPLRIIAFAARPARIASARFDAAVLRSERRGRAAHRAARRRAHAAARVPYPQAARTASLCLQTRGNRRRRSIRRPQRANRRRSRADFAGRARTHRAQVRGRAGNAARDLSVDATPNVVQRGAIGVAMRRHRSARARFRDPRRHARAQDHSLLWRAAARDHRLSPLCRLAGSQPVQTVMVEVRQPGRRREVARNSERR